MTALNKKFLIIFQMELTDGDVKVSLANSTGGMGVSRRLLEDLSTYLYFLYCTVFHIYTESCVLTTPPSPLKSTLIWIDVQGRAFVGFWWLISTFAKGIVFRDKETVLFFRFSAGCLVFFIIFKIVYRILFYST